MVELAYTPSVVGWTTFTPAAGTKIAYVDDAGTAGSGTPALVNASDIADVYNPTTGEVAVADRYATPSAAYTAIRDGEADWILLKRGGTWALTGSSKISWTKSGASSTNRMLLGAFGDLATARPVLTCDTASEGAIRCTSGQMLRVDIAHIEFDGSAESNNVAAVRWLEDNAAAAFDMDITIEGCLFKNTQVLLENNTATEGNFYSKAALRRCVFDGIWCSALYTTGHEDLLVEECIAVNVGVDQMESLNGGSTLACQCWYFAENGSTTLSGDGLVVQGCIIAKVGSTGIQARGGGSVDYNLLVKVPMGMIVGRDAPDTADPYSQIVGNAAIQPTDMPDGVDDVTWGLRGWGYQIGNCSEAVVQSNLVCTGEGNYPGGFLLRGGPTASGALSLILSENIAYQIERGLLIDDESSLLTATIKNNTFFDTASVSSAVQNNSGSVSRWNAAAVANVGNYTFVGNTYWSVDAIGGWFRRTDTGASLASDFAAWVTFTGETGSSDDTNPWIRGGDCTIDAYLAATDSITADAAAAWYTELAAQRLGNWNESLEALPAINWFREGFGLDSIGARPSSLFARSTFILLGD